MTDEDLTDETEDETLEDVTAALEATGHVEDEDTDEADADEGRSLPGPVQALTELHGSGKSLESYEGSPIAEALGGEGSKGGLHVARGVDGLSPLGAMNPIMDIGIGVVLIQLEKADKNTEDGPDFGDTPDAEPEDGEPTNFGDTT